MKKSLKILICAALIALLGTALFACAPYRDYARANGVDLFKDASFADKQGNAVRKAEGAPGDFIDVRLSQAVTLDTVALEEDGKNVTDFKLYYKNAEGEFVFFYRQDLIGNYRYCAFAPVTTDTLRIEVLATKDGSAWKLARVAGYDITKKVSDNFRVMGYAVTGNNLDADKIDAEQLNALTHVNVFGTLRVNAQGRLWFEDLEHNGKIYKDGEAFALELENFRRVTEGTQIKYIATILGKDDVDPDMSSGDVHSSAMEHGDDFIADIKALIEKYDLDGVALDYEYPHTLSENRIYGKFVKKLKQALPADKILSLALSVWQFQTGQFPHSALDYVDQIELMAYDSFEENGFHSSFASGCVNIMNDLKKYNMEKYFSKINLGLPFYSRPTDGYAYWGEYKSYYQDLGQFGNLWKDHIPYDGKTMEYQYFNSYQMIYDKTVYAADNNLGGVMIWHISCDTAYADPLSLLRAIRDGIAARS